MIKNKETEIVNHIIEHIKNLKVKSRVVADDGSVTTKEVEIKTEDGEDGSVKIMRFDSPMPSVNYPSLAGIPSTYSTSISQHTLIALAEIIVRETLAVVIKDTEIAFKDRFDILEAQFDALVNALLTVGAGAATVVPTVIAAYQTAFPVSVRANLKAKELQEGTHIK